VKRKLPSYVEDLQYAKAHGLLEDRLGRAIQRSFSYGIATSFGYRVVGRRVVRDMIRKVLGIPFDEARRSRGDLILGRCLVNDQLVFCLLSVLLEPLLLLGSTGAGKSSLLIFWILQIASNPRIASKIVGQWVFDFRKSGLRVIKEILEPLGIEFINCLARDLKLNILQVPNGMDPRAWAQNVAEMLVRILGLPPRATKLLRATILKLYRDFGVLDGGANYPHLGELSNTIAANKKANPQARMAILDSLAPILHSMEACLTYRRGWNSCDLAKHRILFELGGVSDVEKNLIVNYLVLSEILSRDSAQRENRDSAPQLAVTCDEALRLIGGSSDQSSMSDLVTVARGLGIGIQLCIQNLPSLQHCRNLIGNTPTRIVGRLSSPSDIDTVCSLMALTREQRQWMLHHQQRGMWVAQLGIGDRRPFVFRSPKVDFRRARPTAGDDEIVDPDGFRLIQ
jgi:hypothetical protein